MSGRLVRPRLLSLAALLALASVASHAAAPPETFHDQLAVREAEIVVGLPPALQAERDRSLRPEDFVVRIGGEEHKVIRLSPLARERAPWRLVVVIDPALAHPDTIVASLLALASEADAIADFGKVDLAAADPSGSEIGWIGRDLSGSESIAFALAEAAGKARADRRRNEPHRSLPSRVAADRLGAITHFLLADGGGGPRAVALPLDPLDAQDALAPGDGTGRPSRLLAAYGWSLLPLGLSAESGFSLDGPGVSAYDHWNDTSFVGRALDIRGVLRWLRGKRAMPPPRARVTIESETLPGRFAARGLAEATGGLAIDRAEQIRLTFDALGRRYVLGYEVSAEPKTGEILDLAVASARGSSPAVSPHFARTGASQDLAELTLAGLLANDSPRKELPAQARVESGKLSIEISAPGEDSVPLGPLRISWAIRHAGAAIEMHHEDLEGPKPGGKPIHREIALPPGTDPAAVAVLIQAIGSEAAWGAKMN
ncbi:MAG TPA: hypothetical protein VN851_28245 [Thermoanaerobaculia bacterium]|nr:hypothetical protein [Thermoanaerobaculia bacterium]